MISVGRAPMIEIGGEIAGCVKEDEARKVR